MKLTFIIPAYNEEQSISILYNEIINNVKDYSYEIIFIDDGSKDSTYAKMKEISQNDEKVKTIKFKRNFGKAAALQIGFQEAQGDIVFTMDADLQDNPEEIKNFVEKINQGWDMVCGWKKKRKDPLSKRLPSKFFNFIVNLFFSLKLHDHNCGFKAYKKELVKELDIYGDLHRYIPALAKAKGFSITEIQVSHRKREYGKSKYGIERYTKGFFDLLTVNLITRYNRNPLYLFGSIGLVVFLGGFVIDLYLLYRKLFFQEALSDRPIIFLGVLLIIVGIQILTLGFIAEIIVNQGKESRNSKICIEEKINI